MKIGIVGLPQSGKSTVFAAAAGIDPLASHGKGSHRAVVPVPDDRLEVLAKLVSTPKIVHAEVEFLDTAGFSGQGKSASANVKITEELKLMDALLFALDSFSGTHDPEVDLKNLVDEMILNDLAMIENNVEKLRRTVTSGGAQDRARELEVLLRCQESLENERPLVELDLSENDLKEIRGYTFLSLKPLLVVINIDENRISEASAIEAKFADWHTPGRREVAVICAKVEMEIAQMEPDDRKEFLADLGIANPAVDVVIQKAYHLLGLIPFFTAGEKEARAWTIRKGANAQKAAGVIHSDIERGFIRAEVIGYDDYVACETTVEAKKQGKLRLEGKEYIVQNGDVINFRFNV